MSIGRPVIGLTGMTKQVQAAFGAHPHFTLSNFYITSLELVGAIPVVVPPHATADNEFFDRFDGWVLTGGEDVSPALYGERRQQGTGEPDRSRDEFEMSIAQYAVTQGRPLLAICRGLQVLNVALEGTLIQDITRDLADSRSHWLPEQWDSIGHDVQMAEDSRIARIIGRKAGVNSLHHQGVQRLGHGLRAVAFAEDGLVEAVECEQATFLIGVQWHPECLGRRPAGLSLFEALVQAVA